jgi:hypothetical protein
MGADFGAFFNHADAQFLLQSLCALHQLDGGRQTRRSGTDYYHVKFHGFAFHKHLRLAAAMTNKAQGPG